MSLISNNLRSLFAIACSAVLLAPIAFADSGNSALASAGAQAKVDANLIAASGDVRVYITLASNELAADLSRRRGAIIRAEAKRSSKARSIAAQNPYLFTDQERSVARSIERARNRALPALRAAAEPDVTANEQLAQLIKRRGGEVHTTTPLPNSITATLPAGLIDELSRNELVSSISAASAEPHLLNSPVDGSETWHDAGYIGNGSSADGLGGPDFGVPDLGVRTTHLAFRTRLPGDPNNGPATGPSRITSPQGRTDLTGSEHGNTVAATVANTDLTQPVWSYSKGLAYGVDKVYDPDQAKSGWHWLTGVTYLGEPGVPDLPEAINFSVGAYVDTTDYEAIWSFIDGYIASLGVTYTFPAGNCGFENAGGTGCSGIGVGPHRVTSPGTLFNPITVGGLDYNGDIYNSSVWIPWANSSPGPTWGGRKKPDLIHSVGGGGGGPNDNDDTTYENTGEGTSYAAPAASAGALLLASAGVYAPTAQKAILINTATPIQGQTYWSPKSGWGALDLDAAFHQRANYADSTVTGAAENGVRFFRATGVTSGDRSTLVWNRRTATLSTYHALTNLDLSQHNQATGATTATGGSDAADTVDTDQTVSSTNPMPGSGTDGSDNVEQVRSTSSGTQVLKVKALSSVAAIAAEPFSLASAKPLVALETPVPTVTLEVTPNTAQIGQSATVTADVTNASSDIALTGAQVSLSVPAGVAITSGAATEVFGALATDSTATAVWQVLGSTEGLKTLSAQSQAVAYAETFTGSAEDQLTVDNSPPTVSVTGPGQWSGTADPNFTWSATDPSGIASYDVSTSIGGAAPTLILNDTSSTSGSFTAPEGVSISVLVSAKDTAGNESAPVSATTTIDAIIPTIAISTPVAGPGSASAVVTAANVGSPVSITAAFSTNPAAPLTPLTGSVAYFTHNSVKAQTATLRAQATDALGRTAAAVSAVTVPSKYAGALLKLTKPKSKAGKTAIAGRVNKSARGRVLITATRIGKQGTKRRSARAKIKSGRFSAKLKLAAGRYRVSASYAGSGGVAKGRVVRRVAVR